MPKKKSLADKGAIDFSSFTRKKTKKKKKASSGSKRTKDAEVQSAVCKTEPSSKKDGEYGFGSPGGRMEPPIVICKYKDGVPYLIGSESGYDSLEDAQESLAKLLARTEARRRSVAKAVATRIAKK